MSGDRQWLGELEGRQSEDEHEESAPREQRLVPGKMPRTEVLARWPGRSAVQVKVGERLLSSRTAIAVQRRANGAANPDLHDSAAIAEAGLRDASPEDCPT